ncbi:MAG: hypothetical protein O3C43_07910 [Verrucomicrobia bacterium]|nr:hypothetical protein [Verrucomicrobiota bacterium]
MKAATFPLVGFTVEAVGLALGFGAEAVGLALGFVAALTLVTFLVSVFLAGIF